MSFKTIAAALFSSALLLLTACSDAEKEKALVDLFTAASFDIIAIDFPSDSTETIISIDTFFDYKIEGLQSNGVDVIAINNNIVWSLSGGAVSTIDQNGRFTTGSIAEAVTIMASVGHLSTTLDVTVSAAKFDVVLMLSDTPVTIDMCQSRQIKPIGSYLNDDGTQEIRPVDNTIINTITWLIRNKEDDSPSQRVYIKTENSQASLQALETGDVVIQAEAQSVSSGSDVTSADFDQTLGNNLNTLKLCLKSETDLSACSLNSVDAVIGSVVAVQAVGNYQATDGSNFNQNISANSKWGVDDNSIATIAFSSDRQQLNVTAVISGSTANISAACGNIEQTVSGIENGVVLTKPVSCASGNLGCLTDTAAINVVENTVTSLSVTANGDGLVDDVARVLTERPTVISLSVTANYLDGSSVNVTADSGTSYTNKTPFVITGIINQPGEYTVETSGDAEISISFESNAFTAKITIPSI